MNKEKKLERIVKEFVGKHEISCQESIYQTDRVIENACQLIEELVDVVGYYEYPEDDGCSGGHDACDCRGYCKKRQKDE